MFWHQTTTVRFRLILGVLLSAATLGTTVESASALPLEDLVKIPLKSVFGENDRPLPERNIKVLDKNLNSNNLSLCALPCELDLSGSPKVKPQPKKVKPQPKTALRKRPSSPVLSLPPIKLPNPF
jgi:hypothetical protein